MDRRIVRSKKVLKASMLDLLEIKEFHVITVKELVELADINRSTFYDHYNSKEDLLEEMVEDKLKEIRKTLYEPFQNGQKTVVFQTEYPSLIRLFEYFYREQRFFSTILNSDMAKGLMDELYEELILHGRDNLYFHFKQEVKVNVDLYIHYGMSALLGLITFWIQDSFKYTPEELSHEINKIITNPPFKVTYR